MFNGSVALSLSPLTGAFLIGLLQADQHTLDGEQPMAHAMTSFQLTDEQTAVVSSRSEALRVLAFAGTGKTSVLRAYAMARPEQRMLYLCFNSSIAAEARGKFPGHVHCTTIHSLAYRVVGYRYKHKLRGTLRAHQVAAVLGLNAKDPKDLIQADQAIKALQHFLCSAAEEFTTFGDGGHCRAALAAAARLWQLMQDPREQRVPMLHDGYLKAYQLSAPRLAYGTILLDEAQDANPVTLAILKSQSCTTVLVGDPHQSIYGFRHAVNAMADSSFGEVLALSESFRFGDWIADAANRLLAIKREPRQIRGGLRQAPLESTAYLARGNAALFKRAAELARGGQKAYWVGGLQGYRLEQLLDVWSLRVGDHEAIQDRFIRSFEDYEALSAYCSHQEQRDLKAWIGLIDRHDNHRQIPADVKAVQALAVEQPEAGVIQLATVHKSKGLEWGCVQLAEDYPEAELLVEPHAGNQRDRDPSSWEHGPAACPQLWDQQGFKGAVLLPVEELNLRYVAVTRAQESCQSSQWLTPLFMDLARYAAEYPRAVLLERLVTVPVEQRSPVVLPGAAGQLENIPSPEPAMAATEPDARAAAVEPAVAAPLRPEGLGSPVHEQQAAGKAAAVSSLSQVWFRGALDPELVEVVTTHYERRHPALCWRWLLGELAALRIVSADPAKDLELFLQEQQLGSAQGLVQQFLLDVGLMQYLEG